MMSKEQVLHLYLYGSFTQRSLAEQAGISEKTLYLWIRDGRWKEWKTELLVMPAKIIESIYCQMMAINTSIMERPECIRFGSPREIASLHKLAATIAVVKKHAPLMNALPSYEISPEHEAYDRESPPEPWVEGTEEDRLGEPEIKEEKITVMETGQVAEAIVNEQVAPKNTLREALPVPEKTGNDRQPEAPLDEAQKEMKEELDAFREQMHNKEWLQYQDYVHDLKNALVLVNRFTKQKMLPDNYPIWNNLIPRRDQKSFE